MTSAPPDENWEASCDAEFSKRTGIRINRYTSEEGRPRLSLSFDGANGWTHERLMRGLLLHRERYMPSLLLDLYCDDADVLFREYKIARQLTNNRFFWFEKTRKSTTLTNLLKDLDSSVLTALEVNNFRGFLEGFMPLKDASMIPKFREFATRTAVAILHRMETMNIFNEFISVPSHENLSRVMSFRKWIERGAFRELGLFCSDISAYIKNWKPQRHADQLVRRTGMNTESKFDERMFQLAFAPSGSGKTALIFQELTQKYGLYMVSGSLDRENPAEDILNPKNLPGVSGDTRWLFTMLKHLATSDDLKGNSGLAVDLWDTTFVSRELVFVCFCHSVPQDQISPSLWLSFQIDCLGGDPFLDILRVMSLPLDKIEHLRLPAGPVDLSHMPEIEWVCIDEAQEDLRIQLWPDSNINMLDSAMEAIAWHGLKWQAIVAGTSLDLSDVMKTINRVLTDTERLGWREEFGIHDIDCGYSLFTRFPLITDQNTAKQAMREVIQANGSISFPDELLAEAAKESDKLLWGRVKWTAMYAEAIVEELQENKMKDPRSIDFSGLAQTTYVKVVDQLWDRLAALRERQGGEILLDMLLEAAISADILNKPHIFHQKGSMELVNQGFAIVDCPSITTFQQREAELAEYFYVHDESENKMQAKLKSRRSAEDGIATLLTRVVKNNWTIQECPYLVNSLTTEEAQQGFIVVDCSIQTLAIQLNQHGFRIVSTSGDQLTAFLSRGDAEARKRMDELAKLVAKGDFIVEGCMLKKPTEASLQAGFTIWGDSDRKNLNKALKKFKICIDHNTAAQLTIKDRQDVASLNSLIAWLQKGNRKLVILNKKIAELENRAQDGLIISRDPDRSKRRISNILSSDFVLDVKPDHSILFAGKLMSSTAGTDTDNIVKALLAEGFCVIKQTEQLIDMMSSGLTISFDSKVSLAAKLAEPVVIDAVIRFSFELLEQKFINFSKLAPDKATLGSPAERYLAMRLGRYLAPTIRTRELSETRKIATSGNAKLLESWSNNRACILDILSMATNHEARHIGALTDYALVVGSSTIQHFRSEQDFQNGFLNWLDAIKSGNHWPSASFLLPHTHLGPDIIFALRKADEGSIIICSIQLKLGAVSSQEVVNKSSISWAVQGRAKTAAEEREVLKEDEQTWRNLQETLETNLPKQLRDKARELMNTELMKVEEELKVRDVLQNRKVQLDEEKKTWDNISQSLKETETELTLAEKQLIDKQVEKVKKDLNEVNRRLDEMDMIKGDSNSIKQIRGVLEDSFWKDKLRLSLHVGARAEKGGTTTTHHIRPRTSRPSGLDTLEYFATIGEDATEVLFGAPFEAVLDTLNP